MASLRFKKNGAPFVDFRVHGERYRPEFLSIKEAQKFQRLADAAPVEALKLWNESVSQQRVVFAGEEIVSLSEKTKSFKDDYCSRRTNARDMKRVMDRFLSFIVNRKQTDIVDISSVGLDDLCAFQTHLAIGIEPASVNRYFTTVKTFFKRAQAAGYIKVNYAPLVEGLAVTFTQREHVWDASDTPKLVRRLLETERAQVLIDIARSLDFVPFGPTDFGRIKWRALDADGGVIRTYRLKGKGRRDWNVPIAPGYQALLLAIRTRQMLSGLGGPSDYVYAHEDGRAISAGWVSKAFERARKAVGINAVPYTSRHRVITLVNDSADLKTASKFAGHASVTTTEKHYVVSKDEDFNSKVRGAFAE